MDEDAKRRKILSYKVAIFITYMFGNYIEPVTWMGNTNPERLYIWEVRYESLDNPVVIVTTYAPERALARIKSIIGYESHKEPVVIEELAEEQKARYARQHARNTDYRVRAEALEWILQHKNAARKPWDPQVTGANLKDFVYDYLPGSMVEAVSVHVIESQVRDGYNYDIRRPEAEFDRTFLSESRTFR